MVGASQIAAEPDEGAVQSLVHAASLPQRAAVVRQMRSRRRAAFKELRDGVSQPSE
jgi:hypothetical protein